MMVNAYIYTNRMKQVQTRRKKNIVKPRFRGRNLENKDKQNITRKTKKKLSKSLATEVSFALTH